MILEDMIKNTMDKKIDTDYPYLKLPAILTAQINSVKNNGSIYSYNLKILDKNGVTDDSYPEIPDVKSKLIFESGTIVAIGLLYGELNPYILGEVL